MGNSAQPAMAKDTDQSSYSIWPFRAEELSANGDRNNGGIDLTESPEKIDLIHEATEENGLRQLLIFMNAPSQPFMTLGCLAQQASEGYFSYIELTPRDATSARDEQFITGVHDRWLRWLSGEFPAHPELADALRHNVVWEYREFSLRESAPQYLITIWCRAICAEDHRSLISWVQNFLCATPPGRM